MKSFKEYLTESKKIYEFKIKIAGDHAKDATAQIKASLAEFHVSNVSAGRATPIQERQTDFPEHRNTQMTVYDITTEYPATSLQIRDRVATGLGVTHNHVKVHSMYEEREYEINHQHDERTGEALLGADYEKSDNGNLVNDTHKYNLLKELGKEKHQGTQVKGRNDQILAPSVPGLAPEYRKEKQSKMETAHPSVIGTKPLKGAR
jgi:hypothetical protein